MDFLQYQKAAEVTKKKWETQAGDLADCGLGIAGEAGEVADIIKKHLAGSKPFNDEIIQKLKLEIGDVCWYLASLCSALGFNMNEIAEMNIEKLRKRHGDNYSGYGDRSQES